MEINLFLQCDRTVALDAFFKHITDENTAYIATVCCGCSTATIPVAEISHYWNIPQVLIILIILMWSNNGVLKVTNIGTA